MLPIYKIILLVSFVCLPHLCFAAEDNEIAAQKCQELVTTNNYGDISNAYEIENCLITALPNIFHKEELLRYITLKNGIQKSWENIGEPESKTCKQFSWTFSCTPYYIFVAFVTDYNYVIVMHDYRLNDKFELLSLETGRTHHLPAFPWLSPDGQKLLTVNEQLGFDFHQTTSEIWSFNSNQVVKDFEHVTHGKASAKWISDSKIELKERIYYPMTSFEEITKSGILTKNSNGKWQLEDIE